MGSVSPNWSLVLPRARSRPGHCQVDKIPRNKLIHRGCYTVQRTCTPVGGKSRPSPRAVPTAAQEIQHLQVIFLHLCPEGTLFLYSRDKVFQPPSRPFYCAPGDTSPSSPPTPSSAPLRAACCPRPSASSYFLGVWCSALRELAGSTLPTPLIGRDRNAPVFVADDLGLLHWAPREAFLLRAHLQHPELTRPRGRHLQGTVLGFACC